MPKSRSVFAERSRPPEAATRRKLPPERENPGGVVAVADRGGKILRKRGTAVAKQVVSVAVDAAGMVDPRWGRASTVAVASVDAGGVQDWQVYAVGWDRLHDARTEGMHHAEVARFLQEHAVTDVVANHMGPGMEHMLSRMGIKVHLGAGGEARAAVRDALGSPQP